jgi:excinuclease UvrABC helicase subunit UvrB
MELFRFVNTYGEEEEDRLNLEKWWPYILRIHAVAGAMKATEEEDFDGALAIVEEGREQIKNLSEVEAEEFFVELERSQQALDELTEELRSKKPLSQREILEQRLQEAIDSEEFERAAVIRDELKKLEESDPASSG